MNTEDFLTALCRGREGEDLKELCKKVLMAKPLDKEEREHLAALMLTMFIFRDSSTISGNAYETVRLAMCEALNEVNRHPLDDPE